MNLAEASATLSAGQCYEGINALSTAEGFEGSHEGVQQDQLQCQGRDFDGQEHEEEGEAGHRLTACFHAHLLECAVKKNVVGFIDGGNDVQALVNIDLDAESPCGVSSVHSENQMIQT